MQILYFDFSISFNVVTHLIEYVNCDEWVSTFEIEQIMIQQFDINLHLNASVEALSRDSQAFF